MTAANGRAIRRAQVRQIVQVATDAQGCVCRPDIEVGAARGIESARVRHDRWCPLADAGRFYVMYDTADFGCGR